MVLSRWPYIFVGCLVFVLICIGLITWRCCVARRRRREAAKSRQMRLPDTTPRSPEAHQVSFNHANDSYLEMGETKAYPVESTYPAYPAAAYRTSTASSQRTRV